VLCFYRDVTAEISDEVTAVAGMMYGPDGSKLAVIALCHCGDLRAGEAAAAPVKSFGSPVIDVMGPLTYCEQNALLDAAYPRGALYHWKSNFLASLSDDAIATAVECFAGVASPMSQIFFEHVHGKAASVPVSATAFPHRREGFNLLVFSQWAKPAETETGLRWARETQAAMSRFHGTGLYVNYQSDEGPDVVASAYGANHARLCEAKAKYDPENVFHLNQNIVPKGRAEIS
jgi:hypothetical protein